jgi:transposase
VTCAVIGYDVKAPRRGSSEHRETPIHVTATPDSIPLGITSEDHGDRHGLVAHTQTLPIDRNAVQMVVTDLKVDAATIGILYPNARHQYCVFHIIQAVNRNFRAYLTAHRKTHYPQGQRQEAYKASWVLLKAYERLSEEQCEVAQGLLSLHPEVEPFYLTKEMVRRLFASQNVAQAYAWRDMILEHFETHPEVAKTLNGTYALLRNQFDRCSAYLELNLTYKTNNFTEKVMRKLKKIDKIRYHLRTPESRLRHYRFLLL